MQEICLAGFRGLVQPDSEDKRILSAQLAGDQTCADMYVAFDLISCARPKTPLPFRAHPFSDASRADSFSDENGMLFAKLGGGVIISQHEVLSEMSQIRSVGQLQVSLVSDFNWPH